MAGRRGQSQSPQHCCGFLLVVYNIIIDDFKAQKVDFYSNCHLLSQIDRLSAHKALAAKL